MTYEIPGFVYSLMSEGDILQFAAVVVNSDGNVEAAGDNAIIDGVAQMPASNSDPEVIRVMQKGITIALANEDVGAGELIQVSDTNGRFETRSAGAIVGRALTGTGAAGELFALLLY